MTRSGSEPMHGPLRRTRWTALALLLACAGTLFYPTPSVLPGPDGGARLVLQSGPPTTAAPVSTWAELMESGDASSAPPTGHARRRVTGESHPSGASVAGPTEPGLRIRSGAGLLGLGAVPANAPPRA